MIDIKTSFLTHKIISANLLNFFFLKQSNSFLNHFIANLLTILDTKMSETLRARGSYWLTYFISKIGANFIKKRVRNTFPLNLYFLSVFRILAWDFLVFQIRVCTSVCKTYLRLFVQWQHRAWISFLLQNPEKHLLVQHITCLGQVSIKGSLFIYLLVI